MSRFVFALISCVSFSLAGCGVSSPEVPPPTPRVSQAPSNPGPVEPPPPPGTRPQLQCIYLVAPEPFDPAQYTGDLYRRCPIAAVGCDSHVVPVELMSDTGSDSAGVNALARLFSTTPDEARRLGFTTLVGDGRLQVRGMDPSSNAVELEGRPQFGGVCGVPPFLAQIEKTLEAAEGSSRRSIRLNGSEENWSCLGSEDDEQCPSPALEGGPANAAEVSPGGGIGPIRIGMTRAELEHRGLPVGECPPGMALGPCLKVGPYEVHLGDSGRVRFVDVELASLPDGARAFGTHIPKTETSVERIASNFDHCTPLEVRTGASVITCEHGGVTLLAAGPPGVVHFRVEPPQP